MRLRRQLEDERRERRIADANLRREIRELRRELYLLTGSTEIDAVHKLLQHDFEQLSGTRPYSTAP